MDAMERNRTKNRSPENQIAGPIDSLDTATFLKKFAAYGAYAPGKRRSGLTAEQKDQLSSLEKQIVSLTGWLDLRTQGRQKLRIAAVRCFMIGTWRFL